MLPKHLPPSLMFREGWPIPVEAPLLDELPHFFCGNLLICLHRLLGWGLSWVEKTYINPGQPPGLSWWEGLSICIFVYCQHVDSLGVIVESQLMFPIVIWNDDMTIAVTSTLFMELTGLGICRGIFSATFYGDEKEVCYLAHWWQLGRWTQLNGIKVGKVNNWTRVYVNVRTDLDCCVRNGATS